MTTSSTRKLDLPTATTMPAPTPTSADPSSCVLCAEPNNCALAKSGQSVEGATSTGVVGSCWCVDEVFPAGLIASANALNQGGRCICRACLVAAVADESA